MKTNCSTWLRKCCFSFKSRLNVLQIDSAYQKAQGLIFTSSVNGSANEIKAALVIRSLSFKTLTTFRKLLKTKNIQIVYPNLCLQYQEWKPHEYKGKPALIKIKLRRIKSISVKTNSLGQTYFVRYNRVSLCSKCSFGTGLFVHYNRVLL